jgi:hypothetical protein
MRLYIAGPITGAMHHDLPLFDRAKDLVNRQGHEAVLPAEIDGRGSTREARLRLDIQELAMCDGVALIPGWETSEGTRAERLMAERLGLQRFRIHPDTESLEPELLVGLSGYARSGKDTAAVALSDLGFERRAFADAMKTALYRLNPLIPDGDDLTRIAVVVDTEGWERAKSRPEVRSLLQRLGTQAGRMVLGDDIWVDTALRDLSERTVVTDVRFQNEADAIRSHHGIVIRIERPGVGPVNGHPSETGLEGYPFDAVVQNDGTVEELHANIAAEVGQWIDRSTSLDRSSANSMIGYIRDTDDPRAKEKNDGC